MTVRQIWDGAALLGEGPVWDAAAGVLWFVDIKRRRVHRHDPATGATDAWDAPAQIGWVLPADDGVLLAGLQTGLARFDPASGAFEHLTVVEPETPGNRLNDATVGPDGMVWFGSMDDGETERSGRVYRWDGERVTATDIDPVCITNGPALSPDGRTLYHVDTIGGLIHAVPIEGGRLTVTQVRSGSTVEFDSDDRLTTRGLFLVLTVQLDAPGQLARVGTVTVEGGGRTYQPYTVFQLSADAGYRATADAVIEVDPAHLTGLSAGFQQTEIIHGVQSRAVIALPITAANVDQWRRTTGATVQAQEYQSSEVLP